MDEEKKLEPLNPFDFNNTSQGTEIMHTFDKDSEAKIKLGSNCWICEGWSETRITFVHEVDKENPISADEPTYIVINFGKAGWIPYEMEMDLRQQGEILRMLPPGECQMFFVNGERVMTSSSMEVYEPLDPIAVKVSPNPRTYSWPVRWLSGTSSARASTCSQWLRRQRWTATLSRSR